MSMSRTYLTAAELSARIKYDARTIRNRLVDAVLLEGVHYIRPFGRRKILFIWEAIERDMGLSTGDAEATAMSSGLGDRSADDLGEEALQSEGAYGMRRLGQSERIPMASGRYCNG